MSPLACWIMPLWIFVINGKNWTEYFLVTENHSERGCVFWKRKSWCTYLEFMCWTWTQQARQVLIPWAEGPILTCAWWLLADPCFGHLPCGLRGLQDLLCSANRAHTWHFGKFKTARPEILSMDIRYWEKTTVECETLTIFYKICPFSQQQTEPKPLAYECNPRG